MKVVDNPSSISIKTQPFATKQVPTFTACISIKFAAKGNRAVYDDHGKRQTKH